jgi:ATP-dependent helicase/nuclease subunit A
MNVSEPQPILKRDLELTDEQLDAVSRRSGPLVICAGAGSGKTSVLVERFVRAVREDRIPPAQILAITFTDRAAAELRERLRTRLLELGERDAARELQGAYLSTFHGFCVRLLRGHALQAGLDPEFQILDEGLAASLRECAFATALGDFIALSAEQAVDLVAAYSADRLQAMILDVHDELRSRGEPHPRLQKVIAPAPDTAATHGLRNHAERAIEELRIQTPGKRIERALGVLEALPQALSEASLPVPSPAQLAALCLPNGASALQGAACEAYRTALDSYTGLCVDYHGAHACELLGFLLERFADTYEQLKRDRDALDFDDLELRARTLLDENQQLRASWAERFQMLMVDEFQDSNPRQLAILDALARENLCTVGDEFQSIYGFRHADLRLFTERRERLKDAGATITLERNFRGRAPLLQAVNAIFAARFGEDYIELSCGREREGTPDEDEPLIELLLTDKGTAGSEEGQRPSSESATVAAWRSSEANQLAARIAELIGSGRAAPSDVVVLLRALGDVGVYERALGRLQIPTIAAVGGFWTHQQVGDLLCYLRALANPLDELALFSTLASPLVGLSGDALAAIATQARAGSSSVWETIAEDGNGLRERLNAAEQEALQRFLDRFLGDRRSAQNRTVAELIERAITDGGYREYVLGLDWGERRLANIHKLMRLADRFQTSEGGDLRAFLEHVATLQRGGGSSEPDAPVAEEDLQAVRLMSVHAAKGLEFPVVCMADLGRVPQLRAPDLLIAERGQQGPSSLGVQLVSLDGSQTVPALGFSQLRAQRREREAAEEERIVYVAMTRARERLLLSGAADFSAWPQPTPTGPPIAWLAEALVEDLPGLLEDGGISERTIPATDGVRVRCTLEPSAPATQPQAPRRAASGPPGQRPAPPTLASRRPVGGRIARGQLTLPGLDQQQQGGEAIHGRRTLSYSALSSYARCGYRYYLQSVLGLPEENPQGRAQGATAGRAAGQIAHRLLETIDFTAPEPPDTQTVQRTAGELGVSLSAGELKRIVNLLGGVCSSGPVSRLARAEVLSREQPFAFALHGSQPLITGVFDVLARESPEHWLVLDYKTDRVEGDTDLELLLERDYSIQRLVYALAALRAGARKVEVAHWFLERPEQWVTHSFSDSRALEEKLLQTLGRMRDGGFEVAAIPHRELCLTCPGRRGLCSWEESQTLRERPSG